MGLTEQEKKWIEEGIKWIPEKVGFERRKDKLVCVKKEYAIVDISPVDFLKKLGVVEDGITQEDWNKVFEKMEEEEKEEK